MMRPSPLTQRHSGVVFGEVSVVQRCRPAEIPVLDQSQRVGPVLEAGISREPRHLDLDLSCGSLFQQRHSPQTCQFRTAACICCLCTGRSGRTWSSRDMCEGATERLNMARVEGAPRCLGVKCRVPGDASGSGDHQRSRRPGRQVGTGLCWTELRIWDQKLRWRRSEMYCRGLSVDDSVRIAESDFGPPFKDSTSSLLLLVRIYSSVSAQPSQSRPRFP
jgi:hypothetical protein